MKIRYLLYSFLFILLASCGKQEKETPIPGNGTDTTAAGEQKPEIQIEEALFLNPVKVRARISDTRIMDTLIHFLDCTPKGASVHINIYLFSYEPLLKAVKKAYQRGVVMNVMIDNSRSESIEANKETIPQLQSLFESPSQLVVVKSDVTSSSIDHHKHALFSEIDLPQGTAKNVVFSTSHNFVKEATVKVQDAVVMSNKELYDAFMNNWKDMASRAQSGMRNFTYKVFDLDSIKLFFFPRRIDGQWDGGDNILEALNKLSNYTLDTVRVGMSDWTTGRLDIARKLTDLEKEGVTVEVIAKDKADGEVLEELDALKKAGGYVKILQTSKENIHSKFMLIKGEWDGKNQRIIFCGTHNYTANALKYNNELLMVLKNSLLFKEYNNYFVELKKTL